MEISSNDIQENNAESLTPQENLTVEQASDKVNAEDVQLNSDELASEDITMGTIIEAEAIANASNQEEEYLELENIRQNSESVNADLADLSYLKDIKKHGNDLELTEDDSEEKKRKETEERKRKRQEENDLFARRYKAKSINAAVAQTDPIIYFYNAILDSKGETKLYNVYQVLQDRFVGKLIPQLWMAVAESSDRVVELNIANLIEQMKICDEYPDIGFIIFISARFFTKPSLLQKLIDTIDRPRTNLIMAFDCVSLQNLGTAAKTGLAELKSRGVGIVLDNCEKVSMTTLSELDFDYLRLDSRYYELGNYKSEGFLRMLTQFAHELGIPTIATFCDTVDMVDYMLYMGIDLIQGNAVSKPMRTVPNAFKAITPTDSMKSNN